MRAFHSFATFLVLFLAANANQAQALVDFPTIDIFPGYSYLKAIIEPFWASKFLSDYISTIFPPTHYNQPTIPAPNVPFPHDTDLVEPIKVPVPSKVVPKRSNLASNRKPVAPGQDPLSNKAFPKPSKISKARVYVPADENPMRNDIPTTVESFKVEDDPETIRKQNMLQNLSKQGKEYKLRAETYREQDRTPGGTKYVPNIREILNSPHRPRLKDHIHRAVTNLMNKIRS